jgi:hypothetical protein
MKGMAEESGAAAQAFVAFHCATMGCRDLADKMYEGSDSFRNSAQTPGNLAVSITP